MSSSNEISSESLVKAYVDGLIKDHPRYMSASVTHDRSGVYVRLYPGNVVEHLDPKFFGFDPPDLASIIAMAIYAKEAIQNLDNG